MKLHKNLLLTLLFATSPLAIADGAESLIALDKQWGSAGGPAGYVAEDVMGIGPGGLVSFSDMVAAAATTADEDYVVSGYQVKFLSDDIAVMVHTAAGSDPHASLHVFQKQGENWIVVATASAPDA
ncbi:MAG: hypothetical protein L7T24_00295 [Luminiphilus sp.]|nr:hypothetical protein [Luminiphilus sp.]